MHEERSRFASEVTRWCAECEGLARSDVAPSEFAWSQTYERLIALQERAQALDLQPVHELLSRCAQVLASTRQAGHARSSELRSLLSELSQWASSQAGTPSLQAPSDPFALPPMLTIRRSARPEPIAEPASPPQDFASVARASVSNNLPDLPQVSNETPQAAVGTGRPVQPAVASAVHVGSIPNRPPNFAVSSMLGLRGIGVRPSAAPSAMPTGTPSSMALPGNARGADSGGAVLGLRSRSSRSPALERPDLLPHPASDPHGGPRPGPLPHLGSGQSGPGSSVAGVPVTGEMQELIDRMRGSTQTASGRPGACARPSLGHAKSRKRNDAVPGWMFAAGAAVVLAMVLGITVVVLRLRKPSAVLNTNVVGAGSNGSGSAGSVSAPVAMPKERGFLAEDERLKALVAQVHGRGGKESPELRALLDEEAALQAKLLGMQKCEGDPETCKAMEKTRAFLVGDVPGTLVKRSGNPSQRRWLGGMKMPDVPVSDDERVRKVFEYYTENQVGRELFQSMLFRCGAYRDLIKSTLIRYGLPSGVLAVVFLESGCIPTAKSPVGAMGLWQLMPATGRAYHLRVTDGIDERRSPPKSTEAAVRFLADVHQKLGSWELVFAAYNAGPFGILARIERAGGNATFWDLADNDLLPEETANYVPIIEAFALILENLRRLRFASSQLRAPENTADLDVPPGTRLSLVARAASSSVHQIRALNLDILADRVPGGIQDKIAVQVPKDVVWQAREALQDILARNDDADLCVPETFDWGRQRFTAEMEARCRKRGVPADTKPDASAEH